jgi:hypothetical protein
VLCCVLCGLGLRGQSADIIILEEAAFIDKKMFQVVVAPLMGVNDTVVVAISSPSNSGNYYSELIEMADDDGTPFFKVVRVEGACEECKKAGRELECHHMAHILPPWKSQARLDRLMRYYKGKDDEELFKMENQGTIGRMGNLCFNKGYIDALRNEPLHMITQVQTAIHVAFDPHGGGRQSDSAMIAMVYDQGYQVVSGVYSQRACNLCYVHDICSDMTFG